MNTLRLACVVLMQISLIWPAGECGDFSALGKAIASSIKIINPNLSPCCNSLFATCAKDYGECHDYVKPLELITTCRCMMSIEMQMKRTMDVCMAKAQRKIKLRLEKALNVVVIRKLPEQLLEESSGQGYVNPGKDPNSGAKQPGHINEHTAILNEYFGKK